TQITTAKGGAITTTISSPVTTEEKIKKKNDVKARSMHLMTLLNEHLMTFNQDKDAKSLFAGIKTRFGGFKRLGPRNQDSRNKYQDSSRRTVHVEETPSKAMVAIYGVGFDWSYMAEDEVPINMALIAFLDSKKNGLRFPSYNVVPPPATLVYNTGRCAPLKTDLSYFGLEEFKKPEFESYGPKSYEIESKNASEDIPNKLKEYPDALLVKDRVSDNKDCLVESLVVVEKKTVVPTIAKVEVVRPKQQEKLVRKTIRNMAPRAVLMKTGLRPLNTTRPVNTAHPKAIVYSARPMLRFSKSAQSTGHPQKVQEDQRYVDSGCSRHMIGNMSYLLNFKEFNRGYVTFRGGANGGRITGKETIKTGNLDFKDVYFVKELKFNLFSVSQIVPRKNNIYSVDMKNIVPNKSLTSLVAKTTLDDSMLWHRRLGIRREFSIARTPQQNGVAKRKNRTLIKAARTMLADSKLPTTFWTEAINTACYMQNRILVVKPHKKTPYELFRGRTPALSFMRPFGCHVTILNTLDHLGMFDGKAYEGFFVRYYMNSKAFRVYNIRTRRVEENLHIKFLENKPIIAGDGPEWLFDIDMLTKSMNYVSAVIDRSPLFGSSPKISDAAGSPPSSDAGKKHDEVLNKES
nr:ribonuclease H-like domain-containing protein [Tanacetum cinerariifolium]